MKAVAFTLGITKPQIKTMQKRINKLEIENNVIGLTRVRQAISQRLVEIRLLLRNGHI